MTALEGVNARHLEAGQLPFARFDLVVGDLSFISLALVLPALVPLLGGPLLLLVKPQFELQPVDIGPGGKVKDASAYGHVEKKLRKACAAQRPRRARLVRQRHAGQRRRARVLPPCDASPADRTPTP